MSEQQQVPPLYEEETETEEQKEKKQRLKTLFADLESKQPDFLDEAGKSIIERIATFLAILFAVTALGSTSLPKYLVNNPRDKYLVIAILICYLLAMGMAMWAIHPRNYGLYVYNMTRQEKEWKRLIRHKKFWVRLSGLLFGIGTLALAGLIVSIIWPV
jgi:hypothetical protein